MNGPALGALAIGSVFLYSAVKGKSVLSTAQSIIQGKSAGTVAKTTGISQVVPTDSITLTGGITGGVGTAPKGSYNQSSLQQLWISNGGNPSAAQNAACHGMQESGGDPNAKNGSPCSPGSYAEGLWQICMPLNARYVPGGNAFDPNANAKAAILMSNNGSNWSAWTTPGC
jgi:Lysozyme like domain